jgi:hypothetical protein
MIEKQQNLFRLICDVCGEDSGVGFANFGYAVDYKKANGWKSQMIKDGWQDACPECVELGR